MRQTTIRACKGNPHEAMPVLQNMSAPPHMKISIRPVRVQSSTDLPLPSVEKADEVVDVNGSGLSWITRVDLDHTLRSYFPRLPDLTNCKPGGYISEPGLQTRLCAALAISRHIVQGTRKPTRTEIKKIQGMPFEAATDEFRGLLSGISPVDLGLPMVGVLLPADRFARPPETNALRAFQVLFRAHGGLFLGDAQPMLNRMIHTSPGLDLWAAVRKENT
jgi:hypothetical protein